MGLYQLVYQSQSLVPFETPDLLALLRQARSYNQRHDITGLLLYTPDGRFLQVLEGEQAAVQHLYYDQIVADPRHWQCQVVGEGPCRYRSFTDWSMGFRLAHPQDLRIWLGYVSPDSPALFMPRPHTRPELLALLCEFVAQGDHELWPDSSG